MILDFYTNFQNIKYIDDAHLYYDSNTGESLISVTTLLKKLKSPFESTFWACYTALKRNGFENIRPMKPYKIMVDGAIYDIDDIKLWELEITYKDILKEWDIKSKIGTTLGTFLHNSIENLIHRKELNQEIPAFVSNLPTLKAIEYLNTRKTLTQLASSFYENLTDRYIPLLTEFVIGDADLKIAGTFDLLVLDKETNEIELWDFKTDKEIKTTSEYGNKIKYFNIDDCELNKYSLQLGIYKYLIEKNTSIKIARCKIIHFSSKVQLYTVYDTLDYNDNIKEFFQNDNNKSIYL